MPDPIIDPMTSAVELKRPRVCTNRGALAWLLAALDVSEMEA
jgi:hypothetical protein